MPLGRGRRAPPPMPAPAGVLEHRSRPRNTTRPDALTRGLSAATAGRCRAGARGCHGAREFLPESEEDAEDEEETRVRSGCRLGGAPFLQSPGCLLEMRWRRLATGAERVRSGDRDGGGGRRAVLPPESQEEAEEDEEESRERSGRRPRDASVRHAPSPAGLGFLVTRRRRSRHRRPARGGLREGLLLARWRGAGKRGQLRRGREKRHDLPAGEELVGGGERGRCRGDAELEVAALGVQRRWRQWRDGGVEGEEIRRGDGDGGGHCRRLRQSINT